MVFIGGSSYISANNVIAILQYNCLGKYENKLFWSSSLAKNVVIDISEDSEPKSLVLADKEVYVSAISSGTLIKRVNEFKNSLIEQSLADVEEMEEGEFTDA